MIIYDKYAVSDALKDIRTKNRLTQAGMAEVLGVSNSHYAQIEQGTHGISLELLMKISFEFETDINQILGMKNNAVDKRVIDLNTKIEKLNKEEKDYVLSVFAFMIDGFSSGRRLMA